MKKLAAQDYEDLLQVRNFPFRLLNVPTAPQCSIPAFEGLLDDSEPHRDNRRIMKLLFRTAEWHSFAKLRIHTASTLDHLEALTKDFGQLMRQFHDLICSHFSTTELPHEADARRRQRQRAHIRVPQMERVPMISVSTSTSSSTTAHRNTATSSSTTTCHNAATSSGSSWKLKTLNLTTTKFHALGDYVRAIRMFGCTDSFSTQIVW